MKIIGKRRDGFIVQASESEIANILGYYGSYPSAGCPKLEVGIEIEVSALYNRLNAMRKSEETLADCRKSLRSLADLIDPIDNLIKAAVQVEEEKPNG